MNKDVKSVKFPQYLLWVSCVSKVSLSITECTENERIQNTKQALLIHAQITNNFLITTQYHMNLICKYVKRKLFLKNDHEHLVLK